MKSRYLKNRLSPLASRLSSGTPRIKRIPSSLLSIAAIAGLGLALAPATQAAVIVDDFNTDTSANYFSYNYTTGVENDPAEHTVDDGDNDILQLAGNASGLLHKTATLSIGETYKIDILSLTSAGQILSTSVNPVTGGDGTNTVQSFAARFRWSNGVISTPNSGQGFSGTWTVNGTSPSFTIAGSGTSWVERQTATKFNWYLGADVGTRVLLGGYVLNTDPGTLYIGMNNHGTTSEFDNLQIIPEPSTTGVLAIVGVLGLLRRRRA